MSQYEIDFLTFHELKLITTERQITAERISINQ